MTPAERFTSDAKHLERVAAFLYDRAAFATVDPARVAHQTADTLDKLARDLREYATLYAGRIP